jgi:phenylacetic acid degradation operon negative regulatory protein
VQPTAKSLVLDLLSTVGGRAIPVRALIDAGHLFGISSNGVRVELARLVTRRLVTRDRRGQYRIAPRAQPLGGHVASWTRLEERLVPWCGAWIGVHLAHLPRTPRAALRRRMRALRLMGLRELEPGLFVRPDNLRGGVDDVRRRLHALGLEPAAIVFAMAALDASTDARARRSWDVAGLRAAYRHTRRRLIASEGRLSRLSPDRAMAESFQVGGQAIRQLIYDPLLPEPLMSAAERRGLLDAMRRYDRRGRDCWARFMRERGAPHRRSPAGRGPVAAAGTPPAAMGGAA